MNILSVFNEWVVIGLALAFILITGATIKRQLRKKRATGTRNATGVILSVEKISLEKEQQVEVKMLVLVMPERARNFVGELIETVFLTDLLSMKVGDKVAVQYLNNVNRLILVKNQ